MEVKIDSYKPDPRIAQLRLELEQEEDRHEAWWKQVELPSPNQQVFIALAAATLTILSFVWLGFRHLAKSRRRTIKKILSRDDKTPTAWSKQLARPIDDFVWKTTHIPLELINNSTLSQIYFNTGASSNSFKIKFANSAGKPNIFAPTIMQHQLKLENKSNVKQSKARLSSFIYLAVDKLPMQWTRR